ncbi:MAG: TIGR03087 family PEP-CTERM/XrtA system glycosyltransferase [Anaerolineae bacterium]|nr:TIGR03087 family PEP-CTERM/XrtA system glycosyltransferase [Anaerolineae bacterium]
MRILCLTSRLPYPPHRGDRLRAFHITEHLAREHELSLASFVADEAEQEHVAPLRDHCREVRVVRMSPLRSAVSAVGNAWRRVPLQALYYRSREMQRVVAEMVQATPFDAAYVHLFRMAPYVANYPALYRVVDLTDVISREIGRSLAYRGPVSRLVYTVERPRIERYERWVAQTFEETWLISSADRAALAAACPEANIRVIPNGVDTAGLHPTGQPPEPNTLIFVGHMRVLHNVDAVLYLVQEILPLVRREIPPCRLVVVGADPAPEVQRLAADPAVTVTGFVPDLNAQLNRAAVFVAPLRFAAGVQNKVLEAMAAGRPVVTTRIVNEGLGAVPGEEIVIADDPPTAARQIVALLRDETLRSRIGQAARQFVQRKYSWEHAVRRMKKIEANLHSS